MELCQKFDLVGEVNWYNHKPASVVENEWVKILWNFNINKDHVLYKTEGKCHLIDISVPGDKRIELKKQKKVDNYSKLRWEDLEFVTKCGCSSYYWSPRSKIKKLQRLAEEVRCKE